MLAAHPMAYLDLADSTADEIAELRQALDDEDEEVQIQLEQHGPWHRQIAPRGYGSSKFTACGIKLRPQAAMGPIGWWNQRKSEYSGVLCPACHTGIELAMSEDENRLSLMEDDEEEKSR